MNKIPLPIKLAIAWLWVAIPLGWGVCQSAMKSAPLFDIDRDNSTTTMAPPPTPKVTPMID